MKRRSKEARAVIGMSLSLLLLSGTAARSQNAVETVIFVRHGEKPHEGLGQLNCQGLNRALALPSVITKIFGRPDAIFAPDPDEGITDAGGRFDYVRPLATIEPTAVSFGHGIPMTSTASMSSR